MTDNLGIVAFSLPLYQIESWTKLIKLNFWSEKIRRKVKNTKILVRN